MRDGFLEKYSDLSLSNLSLKLKELLDNETDEIKRIVILASRVDTIRKRIDQITSVLPVKTNKPDNNKVEIKSKDETLDDAAKGEIVEKWIKVTIKESTEVNGVRFPEGIKIDVTKEDSERLIASGKAELV